MFAYVVRTTFVDRAPMEAFVEWLRARHVADVCEAGATDAEIVRLDSTSDTEHAVEVRYRFASREAFARYEREHAPRLRADGLAELARLGLGAEAAPASGDRPRVTFTRTTGEIVER